MRAQLLLTGWHRSKFQNPYNVISDMRNIGNLEYFIDAEEKMLPLDNEM